MTKGTFPTAKAVYIFSATKFIRYNGYIVREQSLCK